MFICSLATLKKSSKKKETEKEKDRVEMFKHASSLRKMAGK